MLQLVLAYGHFCGFLYENVHCHEGGVCEQACVDALVGFGTYNLVFEVFVVFGITGGSAYAECLAGFVFERGCTHKFAYSYVHVQQQVHFADFRNVALHEYCRFVGVESGCEIFSQNVFYVGVQLLWFGVGGEGMQVGDEEVAVVVVLYAYEFAERTVVVAQVQVACGADAAYHYFFF